MRKKFMLFGMLAVCAALGLGLVWPHTAKAESAPPAVTTVYAQDFESAAGGGFDYGTSLFCGRPIVETYDGSKAAKYTGNGAEFISFADAYAGTPLTFSMKFAVEAADDVSKEITLDYVSATNSYSTLKFTGGVDGVAMTNDGRLFDASYVGGVLTFTVVPEEGEDRNTIKIFRTGGDADITEYIDDISVTTAGRKLTHDFKNASAASTAFAPFKVRDWDGNQPTVSLTGDDGEKRLTVARAAGSDQFNNIMWMQRAFPFCRQNVRYDFTMQVAFDNIAEFYVCVENASGAEVENYAVNPAASATFEKKTVLQEGRYDKDTGELQFSLLAADYKPQLRFTVKAADATNASTVSIASYEVSTAAETIGITLDTSNVKTEYTKGDALDTSGLKVYLTKNDYSKTELAAADYTVTGFDPNGADVQTLTVAYGDYKATYGIVLGEIVHGGAAVGDVHNIAATETALYTQDFEAAENGRLDVSDSPVLLGSVAVESYAPFNSKAAVFGVGSTAFSLKNLVAGTPVTFRMRFDYTGFEGGVALDYVDGAGDYTMLTVRKNGVTANKNEARLSGVRYDADSYTLTFTVVPTALTSAQGRQTILVYPATAGQTGSVYIDDFRLTTKGTAIVENFDGYTAGSIPTASTPFVVRNWTTGAQSTPTQSVLTEDDNRLLAVTRPAGDNAFCDVMYMQRQYPLCQPNTAYSFVLNTRTDNIAEWYVVAENANNAADTTLTVNIVSGTARVENNDSATDAAFTDVQYDKATGKLAFTLQTAFKPQLRFTVKAVVAGRDSVLALDSYAVTFEKQLYTVDFDTKDAKTEYRIGEAFDAAGIVVTERYNDYTTVAVDADGFTVEGYDADQKGRQTITVTHTASGKTATYTVTVSVSATGAVLDTASVKTSYAFGEAFTVEGLAVYATYDDGTRTLLRADEYSVFAGGFDAYKPGTYTVTVLYGEHKLTFDVTVAAEQFPDGDEGGAVTEKGCGSAAGASIPALGILLIAAGAMAAGKRKHKA